VVKAAKGSRSPLESRTQAKTGIAWVTRGSGN
jgi:hypothetical protein